jgi:hypothetical protein
MSCAACAPQTDVVAFASDAGTTADSNADADGLAGPQACDPTAASSIYFVEKPLTIHRFAPATSMAILLGPPDCANQMAISDIVSMAVSMDGSLWLADASGAVVVVDPTTTPPRCKAYPFKFVPGASPVALAFLPPPPASSPPLYVVDNSNLIVVDTRSFVQAPVGPLAATGLLGISGTPDGRLYGIGSGSGAQANQALLWLLNPSDASVTSTTMIALPNMRPLRGGAYWGGAFYLFADSSSTTNSLVFTYKLDTGALEGPDLLPAIEVAAVASAPCPTSP